MNYELEIECLGINQRDPWKETDGDWMVTFLGGCTSWSPRSSKIPGFAIGARGDGNSCLHEAGNGRRQLET